jgi:hypothetical protein
VEPENRLVARALERDWEAALAEQARLEADHERVKRARKEAPSAAELAAIRELSQDLPALWRAETTTQQERQTVVCACCSNASWSRWSRARKRSALNAIGMAARARPTRSRVPSRA